MAANVNPHPQFDEIYWASIEDASQRLATKNSARGKNVYGERLVRFQGTEYRLWDPHRSKLAAAILKGLETVPIKPGTKVLYLGAATGTTASHISDIVGNEGHVHCIEFASRSIRELINNVCAFRHNMSPILADARFPKQYSALVGKVDEIYCDIAQPEQAKILSDNADLYLKPNGWTLLAVKARSINVTKDPNEVYNQEMNTLKNRGFAVHEVVHLEPFDKDHAMVVASRSACSPSHAGHNAL